MTIRLLLITSAAATLSSLSTEWAAWGVHVTERDSLGLRDTSEGDSAEEEGFAERPFADGDQGRAAGVFASKSGCYPAPLDPHLLSGVSRRRSSIARDAGEAANKRLLQLERRDSDAARNGIFSMCSQVERRTSSSGEDEGVPCESLSTSAKIRKFSLTDEVPVLPRRRSVNGGRNSYSDVGGGLIMPPSETTYGSGFPRRDRPPTSRPATRRTKSVAAPHRPQEPRMFALISRSDDGIWVFYVRDWKQNEMTVEMVEDGKLKIQGMRLPNVRTAFRVVTVPSNCEVWDWRVEDTVMKVELIGCDEY